MSDRTFGGPAASLDGAVTGAGIEDAVIVPVALAGVLVKRVFRAIFTFLIRIVDYTFPLLMQLARFPLFTLRILGDGVAALVKAIVRTLPLSGAKRDAWLTAVTQGWAWLRQRISYRAFEEAVHRAFEKGMAWVFRTCKRLTPGGALLVIFCAVLWLPISFGLATLLHAFLIAKAASLPAWMQLLHPFGTLIAKSKILILPVYPAAWPQAKKHPAVQALFAFWHYLTSHYLFRKMVYRFRQIDQAFAAAGVAIRETANRLGLVRARDALSGWFRSFAAPIGSSLGAALARIGATLAQVPVLRPIVATYAAHYAGLGPPPEGAVSERSKAFFKRWSVKFSAAYYEAKERGETPDHPALEKPA